MAALKKEVMFRRSVHVACPQPTVRSAARTSRWGGGGTALWSTVIPMQGTSSMVGGFKLNHCTTSPGRWLTRVEQTVEISDRGNRRNS
jgi:hypothetical protein